MSGGGTTGGGSGIPPYLQDAHVALINQSDDGHMPILSMMDVLDATFNNNPYSGTVVYNPVNELTQMSSAVTLVQGLLNDLNHLSDYSAAIVLADDVVDSHIYDLHLSTTIPTIDLSTATIDAEVLAYRNVQLDNLEN